MIGARKRNRLPVPAAKIQQPRALGQSIGQAPRQHDAARSVIERFAQGEPVRGKALDGHRARIDPRR